MLVIKVWCLPPNQTESDLGALHNVIVGVAIDTKGLGVKNQDDMLCLFPADLMKYGLGDELLVEFSGIVGKLETACDISRFAEGLGQAVKAKYPNAKIECRHAPGATFYSA